MPAASNQSVASISVGGREYPLVSEPTCRTCQSPHRRFIEAEAVAGVAWHAIVDRLPDNAGLTARNLSDHFRNQHLPVAAEGVRLLAERDAHEVGETVALGANGVADYLNFARQVVGRVNRRVVSGEVEPSVNDAIRAAQLLSQYDVREEETAPQDYVRGFVIYCEVAQELMGPDLFRDFVHRLARHPVLRQLLAEAGDATGRTR